MGFSLRTSRFDRAIARWLASRNFDSSVGIRIAKYLYKLYAYHDEWGGATVGREYECDGDEQQPDDGCGL
jgi:hypothetical protein